MDEEKPKTDELKSETVNETWFFINDMKTDENDYSFEQEFPIICDDVFGSGFYSSNVGRWTFSKLEKQIIKMVEELCVAKHSAEQKGIPYLCEFEEVEGLPKEQLKNIQIINGDYQFESQLLRYFLTILNEFDRLPYNQNLHYVDQEDEFFSVKLASDNKSKTMLRIKKANRLFCLLPEVHDDDSPLYLIYEDKPNLYSEGKAFNSVFLRQFDGHLYPNNKYYEIADYLTKESQIFITHVYVNSKPSLYEKYDYMVGLSVDMLCKLNKKLTFKAKLDKPISINFEDVYISKKLAQELGFIKKDKKQSKPQHQNAILSELIKNKKIIVDANLYCDQTKKEVWEICRKAVANASDNNIKNLFSCNQSDFFNSSKNPNISKIIKFHR